LINIFHPSSIVADTSKLENGIVLMPNVVISPNCLINSHSQLYANSFVGHDTVLEEMVFVANNASVGGRVIVCKGAHIGSNSSIIERVKIGQYSVIGLGSVVLKNVLDKSIVAGNPAKYITRIHYTN
jgi:acetyltransferase EpsM